MANCITCGNELHPDRARKYDYCMAPECQEKNAKGLTMVAIGMNKAAEEFMILDETTRADLASGKYRDQRRGSFGPPAPAVASGQRPAIRKRPEESAAQRSVTPPAKPWTRSQEKLALLYNEQGQRPDEIARKLGISPRLVTQIILTARNRGKL
jgi:hypothetical protein